MDSNEIHLGTLTLQPGRQLLADGAPLPLRRKPLQILTALANAQGALVTKAELMEVVWPARVVEEGALHAHVVALRKALGAEAGRLKTVHGIGYRLVSDQQAVGFAEPLARAAQPSIAVLPLRVLGGGARHALVGEALPHELIAELSRLRWLFVIARPSSFQFRDAEPDIGRIGAALGVAYCLSGTLEQDGDRIAATVELADTRSLQVIWGERCVASADAVHELRASIVASIIAALEIRIPIHEAQRAAVRSSENLDAWELYHLALQHMYRPGRADADTARALFERAVALDPRFARAHAGISFTHFQHAFMRHGEDVTAAASSAREAAERALELDSADPFANLVYGRSLWLTGGIAESLPWIDRALLLNPNYAQGAYAHAFGDAMLCRGEQGQDHADRAMALSPLDPMQYAMMGSRALSHAVRGDHDQAAEWSDRAARAPNSHRLIAMIAALCHVLAERRPEARRWADAVSAGNPALSRDDFFRAFPFAVPKVREEFSRALATLGF